MAKEFHYTSRKEMEPRPGVRYATTYYKQTQPEYTRLRQHIYAVAAEIVTDMVEQFVKQKDLPSGMLGRWQKLFANTDWDIALVSGVPAKETNFGQLFEAGNSRGV